MKHLLEAPEIRSIDQLVQILNSKNELLNEAHKSKSETFFEPVLVTFFVFRETMLERTEAFLKNYVPSASTMDGIRRKVEEAIRLSVGLCLSRSNPYTPESLSLTEEDAYKSKYLLEYLGFLNDFSTLITRYMEYSIGYGMNPLHGLDSDPGVPLLGGNALLDPEVKGIPVKHSEAEPGNRKKSQKEKEAEAKKAYRIALILLILEIGWEEFTADLTNEGIDMLYAEITGCSQRYFAGNKNNEDPAKFPWKKYTPDAREFMNNLPRIR